jgi:hypothetical protein
MISGADVIIESKCSGFVFARLLLRDPRVSAMAHIVPITTAPVAAMAAILMLVLTALHTTWLEKSSWYHLSEKPVQTPGKKEALNEKIIKNRIGRYKKVYPSTRATEGVVFTTANIIFAQTESL